MSFVQVPIGLFFGLENVLFDVSLEYDLFVIVVNTNIGQKVRQAKCKLLNGRYELLNGKFELLKENKAKK